MQQALYPSDWKLPAHACLAQAGYRCEACGTPHGVLRVGKRSKSPYVVYLHAAHVNHDPDNPQAELRALCPSCHMKHDRQTERKQVTAHKQGYPVVSVTRLRFGDAPGDGSAQRGPAHHARGKWLLLADRGTDRHGDRCA